MSRMRTILTTLGVLLLPGLGLRLTDAQSASICYPGSAVKDGSTILQ